MAKTNIVFLVLLSQSYLHEQSQVHSFQSPQFSVLSIFSILLWHDVCNVLPPPSGIVFILQVCDFGLARGGLGLDGDEPEEAGIQFRPSGGCTRSRKRL